MTSTGEPMECVVLGAGLVGCLASVVLRKRGFTVNLYEKWGDIRNTKAGSGRSINLVLTSRGLHACEIPGLDGLKEELLAMCVPVTGRMMHSVDGATQYQPYGKDDSECNYSISRLELNKHLLNKAEEAGVHLHFEHGLVDAKWEADGGVALTLQRGPDATNQVTVQARAVLGADGGGSGMRYAMRRAGKTEFTEDLCVQGYKEMTFPPTAEGEYCMEKNALHIWPRRTHMMMGLADLHGSFTGTVYMDKQGDDSFATLTTKEDVTAFFQTHYPDAVPLAGGADQMAEEFLKNPVGLLGTVRCDQWSTDRSILLGDAAHAIVPFFGQGCNCGFEDCLVLDTLLAQNPGDLKTVFEEFHNARKQNGDAIADMALDNFVEMRDRVADPAFLLRKAVEREIEKKFPEKFRSRYMMVVGGCVDVPYHVAQKCGRIHEEIMAELCEGLSSADQVDLEKASALLDQKLVPLHQQYSLDLNKVGH